MNYKELILLLASLPEEKRRYFADRVEKKIRSKKLATEFGKFLRHIIKQVAIKYDIELSKQIKSEMLSQAVEIADLIERNTELAKNGIVANEKLIEDTKHLAEANILQLRESEQAYQEENNQAIRLLETKLTEIEKLAQKPKEITIDISPETFTKFFEDTGIQLALTKTRDEIQTAIDKIVRMIPKKTLIKAGDGISIEKVEGRNITTWIINSTSKGSSLAIVKSGGSSGDLSAYFLKSGDTANYITLNNSYVSTGLEGIGTMYWNDTDGTVDVKLSTDVTMQMGQELPVKVYNDTGVQIDNGAPVYIAGRQGHVPKVALAKGDAEVTGTVYGVATHDITDKSYGYVTLLGLVRQIKTNYSGTGAWGTTWAVNDRLYVSKTVAGQLTNVEPAKPHHSDVVGRVAVVGSIGTGAIEVNIDRHKRVDELSDVDGSAPSITGHLMTWNQANSYWDRASYNINDYALVSSLHSPVTVLDTNSVDFTLTGQQISADVKRQNGTFINLTIPDANGLKADLSATGTPSASTLLAGDNSWRSTSALSVVTVDTKANILALTPTAGRICYANDTLKFYIADGTNWKETELELNTELGAPDMGYLQDSARQGIHKNYITDKKLYNVQIKGHPATPENGSIRVNFSTTPNTLEIYMRDTGWYTLIYDLTTATGDFRHTPVSEPIYVWRGDSVTTAINGRPIISEYSVSMGANPPPRVLVGGTF